MWKCPRCGQVFVNRNQWHSCGQNTLVGFLKGRSVAAVALFHGFIDAFRAMGRFELHPAKTRVALVGKMRFCAINRLGEDFLCGHLVFREAYPRAKCFYKIDTVGKRSFVHHFRLTSQADITSELRRFMKRAYAVGQRKDADS
jgi:Domain of unknown function (DUF5655)